MIIYCSKKLATYLKVIDQEVQQPASDLGDWNAHLFSATRKNCIIFMNNKSCYCVLMFDVKKKDLQDPGRIFRERLIRQLDYDLQLTEGREIKVRLECKNVILRPSNNDRKIITTINHYIELIKFKAQQDGGIENLDEVQESLFMNDGVVGTKIMGEKSRYKSYFVPKEAMAELIK
jgi:hypothetical protein